MRSGMQLLLLLLTMAAACNGVELTGNGPSPGPSPTPSITPVATPTVGPSPVLPVTDCGNAPIVLNNQSDLDDNDQDATLCLWPCVDWPGDPNPPHQVQEVFDFDDSPATHISGPTFGPCGY